MTVKKNLYPIALTIFGGIFTGGMGFVLGQAFEFGNVTILAVTLAFFFGVILVAIILHLVSNSPAKLRAVKDHLEIEARNRIAERALSEREERFSRSQRYANIGTWEWNIQTEELIWSDHVSSLFGHDAGKLEPTRANFANAVHPDDRQVLMDAVRESVENGADYNVEVRIIWPDGSVHWISEVGEVEYQKDGTPVRMLGVTADITERKLAEAILRESEERYALAMAGVNEGIFDWDIKNDIVHMSARYQEILGLKNYPSMPGLDWYKYIHPADQDHFRNCLVSHLKRETDFFACEFRLELGKSEECWARGRGKALLDDKGRAYRMAGSMGDISERKRIEKSLQENQNLLRVFLDATIDYAALIDKDGSFLIVNKAMAALYGKSRDELIGRPMLRLPLSEIGQIRQKRFDDVLSSGQAIRATDEQEGRWYDNSYFPVHDYAGKVTRVAIFARDITELKEVEKNLRQLSRAVEQAPNAVFITDTEGTIQFVNSMFTKLTGYTKEEVIGDNSRVLKSGHTSEETYVELWGAIKAGKEWRGEIMDRRKDGSYFWANETIGPVKDENGIITHFVATHEDVTHRKESEIAMREAVKRAEIASRAKSDMLANMSHELRTPLNAIIGFAGSIMAETFGPIGNKKYLEYIGDISNSGEHLLELINDILDVSAIEAGKLDLHEDAVVVDDLVESSIRLISDRAKQKQIHLKTNIQKALPLLYADARRAKQILLNLLSNAVKFTPDGGTVTLSVSHEDDVGHVFTVADTGIGMDHVELGKAMTQFGQVDSRLSRKEEGSGLGLPLTKGLVELHGGTIDIISEKGVGTTVIVKFTEEHIKNL